MEAHLLSLYNGCLHQSELPISWKVASPCFIYKGDEKPREEATSYRPIALLSVVGTLIEKLMVGRLGLVIAEAGMLSDIQYGFRTGRCITDASRKAQAFVAETEDKYVLGVFVDIQGAFDNLWWPSILKRLAEAGCPRNMYGLVETYLTQRRVYLESEGERVERAPEKGCLQGSVLGPRFWNLVFYEVLEL